MKYLALLAAKLTAFLLKILKRGATTLPGRVALLFDSRILKKLSQGVRVILVTGTNGKTTVCRMIERAFVLSKTPYFLNRSGANLITGIATAFIQNCTLKGQIRRHYAVIECDENAFLSVSDFLQPDVIVVTNVFRDQLDRYGEVAHTLSVLRCSVQKCPESTVVLNGDCPLTFSLSRAVHGRVLTFGMEQAACGHFPGNVPSDAARCLFCGEPYRYTYRTYAQLGGFSCPNCGYQRRRPDVYVSVLSGLQAQSSTAEIHLPGSVRHVRINLPGIYNVYNALAAAAALYCAKLPESIIFRALETFSGAFGRNETFAASTHQIRMLLVKNPAGFSLVNAQIAKSQRPFDVCFCLNDLAADGRDVSWIYDVDYSPLLRAGVPLCRVYVSGRRAYDMALCLKLMGFEAQNICLLDFEKEGLLLRTTAESENDFYIVPTYTAMMRLRPAFAQKFGKEAFYE